MSTRGRGYNPRNSLPPKKVKEDKTEETISQEELVTEDVLEESNDEVVEIPNEVENNEDFDKLVDEIHQEVVTHGFQLEEEENLNERLKEIINNNKQEVQFNTSTPDFSRDEIPDIVVSRPEKTKDIYEKYDDLLVKVVQTMNDNKVPVYKFQRNSTTGKAEMVNTLEESKDESTESKLEIIQKMIDNSNNELIKLEIEIHVHEEIIKIEHDKDKVINFQRKIDAFKDSVEHLKMRVNILSNMLK